MGNYEVHVWWAALDREEPAILRLWRSLSADERARSDQFHFRQDRDRYIVGRGLLRSILGDYLAMEPQHLEFRYGPHGKPHLTGQRGGSELCFNLSHANGLAIYAITRNRSIGVDLEQMRAEVQHEVLAGQFFAPGEVADLRALPASKREQAFFACWTRKEAYVKAKGGGLSIPLEHFEVSLQPGAPVRLVSAEEGPAEASRWSLRELNPVPGYAAALCVEGHDWELRCMTMKYRS